ncbi:MAG: threonylcarbamoyl-AMP synthase [Bacteroidetes bacterium]|nr:threonylcarbamoyl-AMP synthase [Bacteroidota bacterium]MCH8032134.1 threonylcarbamoyl-AMP synthase [Bacteroidota bacterium]
MSKSAKLINVEPDIEIAVSEAKKIYYSGGIFIYPTDTIYGFGCNPFNDTALQKLNRIKGRGEQKQYILLVDSVNTLLKYIDLDDDQIIIMLKNIWPNPISFILNLNYKTKNLLKHDAAAFRIPDNTFCLNLLSELKAPLISTSVNISNQQTLTDYPSIKNEFADKVEAIFFMNYKENTGASTLVDLTKKHPKILREGKINFIELWQKLN